jgi:hypothetical protein
MFFELRGRGEVRNLTSENNTFKKPKDTYWKKKKELILEETKVL